MRHILPIFMALALLGASEAAAQRLVILHTNDVHSHIETERVGKYRNLAGVERRLQFIDSMRRRYGADKVLLLDGGDYNQGTPYYTLLHGEVEVELNNIMGYDVATLGNHEFDDGQEVLARRLKKARYQTITCNYDFSATPLRRIVKPYTIVKRGGLKIGIIGVTSYLEGNVMRAHTEKLVRLNTIDEVNRWADYLRNRRGCDLVILLSHLGFEGGSMDRPSDVIVARNSRNLDLIIGGHSHTLLKEAREERDLDGKIIPIVQSGEWGVRVGVLEIE